MPELMGDQNGQERGGERNPAQEYLGLFEQQIHRSTNRSVISLIGAGPQCRKDRRHKEADGQDPFGEGALLESAVFGMRDSLEPLTAGRPATDRQLSAADRLVVVPLSRRFMSMPSSMNHDAKGLWSSSSRTVVAGP